MWRIVIFLIEFLSVNKDGVFLLWKGIAAGAESPKGNKGLQFRLDLRSFAPGDFTILQR